MDEREALMRAVAAAPDDDLPRLVFADWLEEYGDTDYAGFVRAQVELARTPDWEPFAVQCRHRRPEWVGGRPWRDRLPGLDGRLLAWHPSAPFRRGFGWSVAVRQLSALLDEAPRLFDLAPVGQLHLPTATLGEWRRFAAQPWLPRVRSVHFYGTATPIEPVRALCDSPLASGLEELVFRTTGRPGMPVLLADLLRSDLGRRLRRLELHAGPVGAEGADELYRALVEAEPGPRLERLALVNMAAWLGREADLYGSPVLSGATELELMNVRGASLTALFGRMPALTRYQAADCALFDPNMIWLLDNALAGSQCEEVMERWSRTVLGAADGLAGLSALRSLTLPRTLLPDDVVPAWLTRAAFWPNLTELDLRNNRITDAGADHLLAAPVPAELTAVLLDGNPIGPEAAGRLRAHFGDRLVTSA